MLNLLIRIPIISVEYNYETGNKLDPKLIERGTALVSVDHIRYIESMDGGLWHRISLGGEDVVYTALDVDEIEVLIDIKRSEMNQ